MDKFSNSLNWFEIPATNILRAKKFYEAIFSIKMDVLPEMMGMKMVGFPSETGSGKVTGGITQSQMHKPSQDGCVIYLNADPDIQIIIDRIVSAGGKVVMQKTQVTPEYGYMAFFIDTEGNKIGLHSRK